MLSIRFYMPILCDYMILKMSKLIIFMLTVLFIPFASAASPLTPEEAARKSDGIWVFEDPSNSLTAQDVISKADQFTVRQDTHVGISDSTWWVKVPYDSRHIHDQFFGA